MFHKWFVAFWFLVVVILVAVSISGAIFEKEATTTFDIGAANIAMTDVIILAGEKVDDQVASVQLMIDNANADVAQIPSLIVIWCDFVDQTFGL